RRTYSLSGLARAATPRRAAGGPRSDSSARHDRGPPPRVDGARVGCRPADPDRPDVGRSHQMTTAHVRSAATGEPSTEADIDPITAAVIGGGLRSIAVEMGYRLARVADSSILRESEGLGCAICGQDGRQLCEATQSTPLQSGPIGGYLEGIDRRFAEVGDEWRPGDVVVHNHPYYGSSHQPDVGFAVPVFVDGELVGFSMTTAHHLDL